MILRWWWLKDAVVTWIFFLLWAGGQRKVAARCEWRECWECESAGDIMCTLLGWNRGREMSDCRFRVRQSLLGVATYTSVLRPSRPAGVWPLTTVDWLIRSFTGSPIIEPMTMRSTTLGLLGGRGQWRQIDSELEQKQIDSLDLAPRTDTKRL
jgi:hypothetical protein